MIIDISIGIIALAFFILVVYLAMTLVTVRKTLRRLNHTLKEVDQKLIPISEEVKKLLITSNSLAENTLKKTENLDPLFHSIANIGQFASEATAALRGKSHCDCIEVKEEQDPTRKIADWVEVAALGVALLQKIKKGVQR